MPAYVIVEPELGEGVATMRMVAAEGL